MTSLQDLIGKESIIFPEDKATNSFVYPALTLPQRDCSFNCRQGTCNSLGECECHGQYVGIHCDVFCNGAVEAGECLDIRTVYVGGMVIDATVEEYISAMNLAVDLVNNKTDGFF